LFSISKGSEWTVDQTDDFTQVNLDGGRRTRNHPCPANAFHHTGVLHFQQNEFEEFFGQVFFVGDVSNLDRAWL